MNEAILRQTAAARAATQPELAKRLERAVCLILSGKVMLIDRQHAEVESQREPGVVYAVNGSCPCPDAQHQAPNGWCAHRLAVDLLRALPAEPQRECPEAAFSITLKGTMSGHEVLLTARGQTWDEFSRNVERLRGLLDQAETRHAETSPAANGPAPASPAQPPVCPTHGPMKPSTKAPGTFYCTKKLYDGSYCQSRYPEA